MDTFDEFPQIKNSLLLDAIDSMDEAFVVYNAEGHLLVCNQSFMDMYGYTPDEAKPGVHFQDLGKIDVIHGNVVVEDEEGGDYLKRKAAYRQSLKGSFTVKLLDGRWIRTTDRRMQSGGFVSVHVDITDIKDAQIRMRQAQLEAEQHENELAKLNENLERAVTERTAQLEEAKTLAENLARTDSLTGLKNRRALFEYGNHFHDSAKRYDRRYSVLMIDIDHFKKINDTYGHLAGDLALKELSDVVTKLIRSTDIAARIGGEEFAVILPEAPIEKVTRLAERLCASASEIVVPLKSCEVKFTVSIGMADYGNADLSFEDVLARADAAMYQAKSQGRNKVVGPHR